MLLEDLTGMGPHDSEEFKLALMISDIHQEVHGLVKSCDSHKMLSKLAIQIKPAKGIIAKAAFPKGKLVLVPYSMKTSAHCLCFFSGGAPEGTAAVPTRASKLKWAGQVSSIVGRANGCAMLCVFCCLTGVVYFRPMDPEMVAAGCRAHRTLCSGNPDFC